VRRYGDQRGGRYDKCDSQAYLMHVKMLCACERRYVYAPEQPLYAPLFHVPQSLNTPPTVGTSFFMESVQNLKKDILALLFKSVVSNIGDAVMLAREAVKRGLGVYIIVATSSENPLAVIMEPVKKEHSVSVVDYSPELVSEYVKAGKFNHRWIAVFQARSSGPFATWYVDVVNVSKRSAIERIKTLLEKAFFVDISPVEDDVYLLSHREAVYVYAVKEMEEHINGSSMKICSKNIGNPPQVDYNVLEKFRCLLRDALIHGRSDVVVKYANLLVLDAVKDLCKGSGPNNCHPYVAQFLDRMKKVTATVFEKALEQLSKFLATGNGVVAVEDIYRNLDDKFILVIDDNAFVAYGVECLQLEFESLSHVLRKWNPYGSWLVASSKTGKKKEFRIGLHIPLESAWAEVYTALREAGVL